jgi:hypothetical protein
MPQIGDTVYLFDENRRVYARNGAGRSSGGPIYREHFLPYLIVGEEKRSWILDKEGRVGGGAPWPGKTSKTKVMTEEEVEAACWRNDHRMAVSDAVRRCEDTEVLKQVAALVGYVPPA